MEVENPSRESLGQLVSEFTQQKIRALKVYGKILNEDDQLAAVSMDKQVLAG